MEEFWDIILDTLLDSVKMLPFLFGAYLLIEFLEHKASDKLQNAFSSLTDEEKELIWLLYLCKEPLTETQVASVLHISQPAVHKRKKRILEKMRSFWL